MRRERILDAMPWLALVALNVVYRLPALLNAAGVNSDAAIAGLQAMHLLNGESSRFLWGAGYQGTFEIWIIAAFFAVGGPTPLMLMLAPLAGHLVLSSVMFGFLQALLGRRSTAFIATLPLTFAPQAINGVATSSPRQWSVTVALCAVMLIAWPARRAGLRLTVGLLMLGFSLYLDLVNLMWMPAAGLLVLLLCCDPALPNHAVDRRFAGAGLGLLGGALLLAALRHGAPQEHAAFNFGLDFVGRNWPLLSDISLPWLLGAKVWMPGWSEFPELWSPPWPVRAFQWLGAASVVLLAAASAWLSLRPAAKWEVRAVVWFGLTTSATTLGGFLLSNWPVDLWSTRYLAPIVWSLPFSLAALAGTVRPRTFGLVMAPYLIVAAMGGWLSFGSYVSGLLPRIDEWGSGRNELALGQFLRERGYEHGYADYWLAHRLTFLWQERPTLAAFGTNRYPPYADAADRATRKAYVFHSRERARLDQVLSDLKTRSGRLDVVTVAGFTVILWSP